jgi:hypothetical protein
MSQKFIDEFHWIDWSDIDGQNDEILTDVQKYERIVGWARKAKGQNPNAFDMLTEWILDDFQWCDKKLAENEQILMQVCLHGSGSRISGSVCT